jgi:hypothetical protein
MLRRVRRKNRVVPVVVLAILVAVNAYLIALLLRPEPEIAAEPVAPSTAATTRTATPSASSPNPEQSHSSTSSSPSPQSSPSSKPEPEVIPTKRLIAAASARLAWRATVGDCKTSGTVERSTDGGKTWRRALKSDLAPIVRLAFDGAGNIYTVGGAGETCSTQYTAYSSDGDTTESTGTPMDIWFSRPKDRDQVYSPDNIKAAPCDKGHVVGLSSLSTSDALVICTDGAAMVTSDSGKSWAEAANVPGTLAVGSGGDRYWIAGTTATCDGISIRSLQASDGELSRGPSRCAPASNVTPGGVAIDYSDNTIWLWAGKKVKTSSDSGRSWI